MVKFTVFILHKSKYMSWELSLKFERHFISEIIDFELLRESYFLIQQASRFSCIWWRRRRWECFDMRVRSSVGRINVVAPAGDIDQEVTAVEFDGEGGDFMAVGSSAGKVLIYDLRSSQSQPMRVKDHMYGSPISNIKCHQTFNSERAKLITMDNKIVRIWDPETGEGMTSIEPTAGAINDICVFDGSGLDYSQILSYFIRALGPTPKWCSYLENLTEEMEKGAQTTIYDDFKFLIKEDLERLNLTNLIGTNPLRACMHGFFIDYQLYKKVMTLIICVVLFCDLICIF
ncbi:hypothetical protein RHSIM_Rhsim06G0100100 [Rhododendron simsii]|uniref:Uncharacterized protein n=1 Tax=Rhododendron simsii TaxID=118357 RepID=A0A834LHK3_RHOSS|nr:hypothetical protein RHSIM_Rhsim06G0100100 [Rhododendron simsii]